VATVAVSASVLAWQLWEAKGDLYHKYTDLENIVHKAVAAAVAVIRQEFSQRLSVLEARLEAVETKLVDMESIGAAQSTADDGSLARELEAVKRMSWDSALQANDNEQYSRRNNL